MSSAQNNEVFLFFGMSGSGKSSTINQISRQTLCSVSDKGTSQTQGCQLVHVTSPNSAFTGKCLLDMQGFYDTRKGESTEKLFNRIKIFFSQW